LGSLREGDGGLQKKKKKNSRGLRGEGVLYPLIGERA